MKIAVICANGRAGRRIVQEALSRGIDVTAVVRESNQTEAKQVLKKDLFDLTADDLKGFDAVIDAFGAWTEDTLPQHSTSLKHLCDVLSGTETRLLVVGGGDLIRIHFHTNEPWMVLEYCASLGEIHDIVIEDMDRQARGLQG